MGTVVELEPAYDTAASLRCMQAELIELQSAHQRSLQLALAMGEMLAEEKSARKGSFLAWLAEEVMTIRERTARRYMALHEHRDALKSASVADLASAYRFVANLSESSADEGPEPCPNGQELKKARVLARLKEGEKVESICAAEHCSTRTVTAVRSEAGLPKCKPGPAKGEASVASLSLDEISDTLQSCARRKESALTVLANAWETASPEERARFQNELNQDRKATRKLVKLTGVSL